jgi:hypothetical protein
MAAGAENCVQIRNVMKSACLMLIMIVSESLIHLVKSRPISYAPVYDMLLTVQLLLRQIKWKSNPFIECLCENYSFKTLFT